jgi:hypothetical protein
MTTDGNTLSVTLSGLMNGTACTIAVAAVNAIGTGPAATTTVTPSATPITATPTGVTACPADSQATISFGAVKDAASYNLYYGQSPTGLTASGSKVVGVNSPYTVKGLTNGNTYYFVVTAVGALGESLPSVTAQANVDSAVHDTLFVTDSYKRINMFDCYSNLPAGAGPTRQILSPNLWVTGIFVDGTRAEVYAAIRSLPGVTTWKNATLVSGSSPPDRTISTTYAPNALYADLSAGHNVLYVTARRNPDMDSISAFGSATTITGSPTPRSTVDFQMRLSQITGDPAHDKLFSAASELPTALPLVGSASTATPQATSLTITGFDSPYPSVALDVTTDTLYLVKGSSAAAISSATSATSPVTPTNVLLFGKYETSSASAGFAINDRLWVAFVDGTIFEYGLAHGASGDQKPTKITSLGVQPGAGGIGGVFYVP